MRQWQLEPGAPLSLQLAADARFGPVDAQVDLVWTLDLAATTLRTQLSESTYIALTVNGRSPLLRHFAPNYLHTILHTDDGHPVDVIWWAPRSHTIAVQISPAHAAHVVENTGPDNWPWPYHAAVAPGRFVLTCHPEPAAAQRLAESTLASDWEADFAKIAAMQDRATTIATGNTTWDAALTLSQNLVLQQIVAGPDTPPQLLPGRTTTINGRTSTVTQSTLDFYVNFPVVADASPHLATELLCHYLTNHYYVSGPPLLASLVWDHYQAVADRAFLQEAAPVLEDHLQHWWEHDHDQDGVPEWRHANQPNVGPHPLFGPSSSQRLDIRAVEAPDLLAYLYRATRALIAIASELNRSLDPAHESLISQLQAALTTMWQKPSRSYHYRDRDGHHLPIPTTILDIAQENGLTAVSTPTHAYLPQPSRLILRLERLAKAPSADLEITVEGNDADDWSDRESFTAADVTWHGRIGFATGQTRWLSVHRVHATGLDGAIIRLQLATPDLTLQDSNLLLPLWAGMAPATEQSHLLRTIIDPMRYWRRFGIPTCAATEPVYSINPAARAISVAKNSMLGEGLLAAGKRQETAVLVNRLMQAVIHSLQNENCFRQTYQADEPGGAGGANHPGGVAPYRLFLDCVGVRIISAEKVVLSGYNPFPWPVTISQHGVTVTRPPGRKAEPIVLFPAGVHGSIDWQHDEKPISP